MAMIQSLAAQLVQMTLILVLSPLLTGLVRKVKARLQRRRGPPLMQPYRDLRRLLGKEAVVAENASWLFRIVPYFVFASTWVAAGLIPTFAANLMFSWSGDMIAITALLGSARFALALAAMDIGTSFGGIGASREVMIASLAEPALLMIVFSVALIVGSTQLSTIAETMLNGQVGLRVSLGLALIALIIVAVAENGRVPVDNPATHLELTMVHEAMILEYSARHLAMIELAAALKLTLYIAMIVCIFVPVGMADGPTQPVPDAIGVAAWLAKMAAGGVALGVAEMSVAKMRVFRVPNFLGAALMLGLLGVLLLFVSRGM
jgi:formate hydrogenlyase subunit 4